ncbi:hypothetical protein AMTRI_Chr09g41850 [Amborella trichopoda]
MQKDKKATTRLAKQRTHNSTPPTQYNVSVKYMHHEVKEKFHYLDCFIQKKKQRAITYLTSIHFLLISASPSKKLLENFGKEISDVPPMSKNNLFLG